VEQQLLNLSPRTIDYRLPPKKRQLKKRIYGRTKPGTLLKHHIPVKTDGWDVQQPGFTEVDLVSHAGNCASGDCSFAEPHRHPHHVGGDSGCPGQRARRSPSHYGSHPLSLAV
jgi:hypothetical protein